MRRSTILATLLQVAACASAGPARRKSEVGPWLEPPRVEAHDGRTAPPPAET
jgi:hypothetical protein